MTIHSNEDPIVLTTIDDFETLPQVGRDYIVQQCSELTEPTVKQVRVTKIEAPDDRGDSGAVECLDEFDTQLSYPLEVWYDLKPQQVRNQT